VVVELARTAFQVLALVELVAVEMEAMHLVELLVRQIRVRAVAVAVMLLPTDRQVALVAQD
jgi:hypothetical protein